jgi:hypothetical protein
VPIEPWPESELIWGNSVYCASGFHQASSSSIRGGTTIGIPRIRGERLDCGSKCCGACRQYCGRRQSPNGRENIHIAVHCLLGLRDHALKGTRRSNQLNLKIHGRENIHIAVHCLLGLPKVGSFELRKDEIDSVP